MNPRSLPTLHPLLQLVNIRSRCQFLYGLAEADELNHFSLQMQNFDQAMNYILSSVRKDYPTLAVPPHSRWRHFEAGGQDRVGAFANSWIEADKWEVARRKIDLAFVSVLLDAGAGPQWSFREKGQVFVRSEGLALASLHMFERGNFGQPFRVTAAGLSALRVEHVLSGFQVSKENPLIGVPGRVALLNKLGRSLSSLPQYFARDGEARPGHVLDYLVGQGGTHPRVSIHDLWALLSAALIPIWPAEERAQIEGRCLGDVWFHSKGKEDGYVPFHKLTQWLAYSLIEPMQECGIEVTEVGALTGLPEYRNGGLWIDLGVLRPKASDAVSKSYRPGDEFVVEWRALTVVLLDKAAAWMRSALSMSEREWPLAKMLEAGTWKAGRRIAAEKRPGGVPPIRIESDGTVF